jgi:hypothetical protein
MKRHYIITLLVVLTIVAGRPATAQESVERYTASNGLVLTEGDSITIGVGSYPSGAYGHIFMSSLISPLSEGNIEMCKGSYKLQPGQEGATVPIKKIKKANGKIYLFVPLGGSTPFIIELEDAIDECEIAYCRPAGYLNQQEFEKLMLMNEAFKSGSLTEERFYGLRKEFLETAPEPQHLE